MTERDQEEQDLRIEMMKTQHDLFKSQLRWETWKAIATIGAAVAAMAGIILGVAHVIH